MPPLLGITLAPWRRFNVRRTTSGLRGNPAGSDSLAFCESFSEVSCIEQQLRNFEEHDGPSPP
jgi:hypothetical protein